MKLTRAKDDKLLQETWYIDRLVNALTDAPPYLALFPLEVASCFNPIRNPI